MTWAGDNTAGGARGAGARLRRLLRRAGALLRGRGGARRLAPPRGAPACGGGAEVDTLTSAFARMVEQVRARDEALRAANDRLEHEVSARTADLAATAENLRRSEARLRLILDSTADGIVTFDALGHVESINRAAADTLGLDPVAVVGRHVGALLDPRFGIEEDGRLFVVESDEARRDLGRAAEVVARRADTGAAVPVHVAISDCDLDGRRLFIALVRDITAQQAAQRERDELHGRLFEASRHAGMAEIATGVLHNVGNVLNSVNVATGVVLDKLRQSRLPSLARAAQLIDERAADLAAFITHDERGRHLPAFLTQLAAVLQDDHQSIVDEITGLSRNVDHIKQIVQTQQSYAKRIGTTDAVALSELVEDAIRINAAALERLGVRIERHYRPVPPLVTERHKVLQVLVNFVSNARHALGVAPEPRVLTLVVMPCPHDPQRAQVHVTDNGVGIAPDNLARIFTHGFTTKANGHGFGLHSGVVAAHALGGELRVQSDGPGKGATFILELPLTPPDRAAAPPPPAPPPAPAAAAPAPTEAQP